MKDWYRIFRAPEGEPGEGGAGGGDEGDGLPRTIPISVLPQELQDLSEQELAFFLKRTISGVSAANQRNKELEQRLEQLERDRRSQPEKETKPTKPITELILEDPEAAVEEIARKKGWIKGMEEVGEKTDDALFEVVAAKIPDFEEHEEEVREILKRTNSPITKETIVGAFTMAVGNKAIAEKQKARRKAQNPEKVAAVKEQAPTLPEESELEKEVREAHGKTREQWEEAKKGEFKIKLPLTAGRK